MAQLLVEFRDHMSLDWPSDNAFYAGVERLLEDPDTEYLLGSPDDDSPPAGVVQLRYRHALWWAAEDCTLEDLFVREEARGSGLGRTLVEATIARARERGCRRIELDVWERNEAALVALPQPGLQGRGRPRHRGPAPLHALPPGGVKTGAGPPLPLLEAEPGVEAPQRSGRPPVPLAEQPHQRRARAARGRSSRRSGRRHACPTAICFMKNTELTANARKTTAIITAAAVITRPVRPIPVATASSFERPEVVLLLDARHHEHGVVGRQAER